MHEWRYIAVPGSWERQREGAASRGRAELRGAATASAGSSRLSITCGAGITWQHHLQPHLDAAGTALAARGNKEDPFCRSNLNMGCSLCTLQKPEEQYKLLYEVCQVKNEISFLEENGLF